MMLMTADRSGADTATCVIGYPSVGGARSDHLSDSAANRWGEAVAQIIVGEVRYDFREPIRPDLFWHEPNHRWICRAGELPLVSGSGNTKVGARRQWELVLHATFQRLFAKRPFQLNAADARLRRSLVKLIDTNAYFDNLRFVLRELGEIRHKGLPFPSEIHWVDGRIEHFALSQVPAELAAYPDRQWIEAMVERNFRELKFVKIVQCTPIEPINLEKSGAGRNEMVVADLAKADWKWPSVGH